MSYLKKHEPIGCRDQRTFDYLKSCSIDCYLNGCTASILQLLRNGNEDYSDRFLFVDVPYSLKNRLNGINGKSIDFLNQELYCKRDDFVGFSSPADWAESVLSFYKRNYAGVLTSRFHGAVLALAASIPVALTLEEYTFRFSWLQNYCPLYTEKIQNEFDWKIVNKEFADTKSMIEEIAQLRILQKEVPQQLFRKISAVQHSSEKHVESNQVYYYRKAYKKICELWDTDEIIEYGFWGVNDNTTKLFELISSSFKNARLVEIYDMFRHVLFNGLSSMPPSTSVKRVNQNNYYIIVSAYLASRVASDVFGSIGFPMERVILCERDFVMSSDLS